MTSVISSNLQWEVAGKRTLRKNTAVANGTNGTNGFADVNGKKKATAVNGGRGGGVIDVSKFPRLEAAAPLKPEASIYDLIRDSDDDDDLDLKKPVTRQNKKTNQTILLSSSISSTGGGTPSPKSRKSDKPKQQPQEEPLNLVSQSQLTSRAKKATTPASAATPLMSGRKAESELENAIAQLKFDDFKSEHSKLKALFPNSISLVIENLIAFANQKLQVVAEFEPSTEQVPNPTGYMSKLDKNLLRFLNELIVKCSSLDQFKLFNSCFDIMLTETQKPIPTHGYKLFIQLLLNQTPSLFIQNMFQLRDTLISNKHRHQKCLQALWAIGQAGYFNLTNGLKLWFDVMLPFIQIKNLSKYIIWYLSSIFEYHKIGMKTQLNLKPTSTVQNGVNEITEPILTIEQYFKMFDLNSEKQQLNLSKDLQTKLTNSFLIMRNIFAQELSQNGEFYFEDLLTMMITDNQKRTTELLEFASRCVLSQNRRVLSVWKQVFPKHQKQTFWLLDHMSKTNYKCFKQVKGLSDLIFYFDKETSNKLAQYTTTRESGGPSPGGKTYYLKKANKSSAEIQVLQNNDKLVKLIIKQNYQRTSVFSMVLRTLFYASIAISLFFVWDVNKNKSVYTNSVKKELQKYGLLEPLTNLAQSINQLALNLQKTFNHYFPIWYRKTYQTVAPIASQAWNSTNHYAKIAWTSSEPYRLTLIDTYNQAVVYTNKNFPVFVKNLTSVVELTINYATTLINVASVYLGYATDFIGMQLLGWKKGALEQIFIDAFKVLLLNVTRFFQYLSSLSE